MDRIARRGILALLTALTFCLIGGLVGCGREDVGDMGAEDVPLNEEEELRIVSLAPALTRILVDLGMGDAIVGVVANDAAAPADATIIGAYPDIDRELLRRLEPSVVILMVGQGGVPEQVQAMAEAEQFDLMSYPYPNHINDVAKIIFDPAEINLENLPESPRLSLGTAFGVQEDAQELQRVMFERIAAIDRATSDADRRQVLLVFGGGNAINAVGKGTVLDSLLPSLHASNVLDPSQGTAPEFDREKLLSLPIKPEVIVILDPGGQPLSSIQTDPRTALLRSLDLPAVTTGNVRVVTDPLILLPSSSLGVSAVSLAKAIHPRLAGALDKMTDTASTDPAGAAPGESSVGGVAAPGSPAPAANESPVQAR